MSGQARHRLPSSNPPAPQGRISGGLRPTSASPLVLRIRAHNIIPSGLCNSRWRRHCNATRSSRCKGQQPVSAASYASDYTIRIMLSVSQLPSPDRHAKGPPTRGGGGQGICAREGTTPPLRRKFRTLRVRQGNVSAKIRGRKVQHRGTGIKKKRGVSRWELRCYASSPPP